ncbi:MAG: CBS domain-containing protein [Alphaproteobacteria bacterium]
MKVAVVIKAKGSRVATTRPELTIGTVAHRLTMENVGALVVSNDDKTVLGMISESDIVHGLAEHGAALLDMRVDELMGLGIPSCTPEESINQVMARMTRERMRYLPVVEHGKLCGVISIGDVVKHRLDEIQLEAAVLRDTAGKPD